MVSEVESKLMTHEAVKRGPVSFIGTQFTKELVSKYISYDAETGIFTRIQTSGSKKSGDIVGCVAGKYLQINVCGKRLRGHQLAWLFVHGRLPKLIDHINGDGLDNRICNLREVSQKENVHNFRKLPSHNTTGFLGVSYYKAGKKFSSHINLNGKKIHLGYFDSPNIAHQAYLNAKRKLHSTCTI